MGTDIADINRDGWLDIYVTNLYENVLFLNNGDGTFTEIGKGAGVDDYGMGWGTNFLDYDNDGWVDLYVGNDSYFSPYPNVLYQNLGDNTFEIVEEQGAVSSNMGAYGTAVFDLDLDGKQDLFIANTGTDNYNQLFRNTYPEGNWIGFQLEGVESNRDAIGARVLCWDGQGVLHLDEVLNSVGFASQNSPRLHFGLGEANRVDSMHILWPNGLIQQIGELSSGYYYQVKEGQEPEVLKTEITSIPKNFFKNLGGLESVFPNPASDQVFIQFKLERTAAYRLSILDSFGRKIRQFARREAIAGEHYLSWDGRDEGGQRVPSGIYFIEFSIEGRSMTRQVVWK